MMKEKKKVETPAVAIPPAFISQAVAYGDLLFVSGQCGMDAQDHVASDTVEGQVEQALQNLQAVLTAAGSGMDRILICHCFLRNLSDFDRMNSVYRKYFSDMDVAPARYTVLAGIAHPDLLFEISVVAALNP